MREDKIVLSLPYTLSLDEEGDSRMNSLLWVLFWIGAIVGSIFAGYAAGTLGILSFLILISALSR